MSLLMNSFQAVEKARGARQNNLVEQITPTGEGQDTPATAPPAPEAKSSASLLGTARCLTLSPLPPVAIPSHGALAQRVLNAGQPRPARSRYGLLWWVLLLVLVGGLLWVHGFLPGNLP